MSATSTKRPRRRPKLGDTINRAFDAPRDAYSCGEVAARLGTTRRQIARSIERGEMRSFRLGGRVFIPAAELERLLVADAGAGGAL